MGLVGRLRKAYLFDVRTGISVRIDDVAHEVLKLLKENSQGEVIKKLRGRFSHQTLDEVFLGIHHLHKQGLFKPQREQSPEEVDTYIKRIVKRKSPSIQLAVVQGCNMRCGYCYERGMFDNSEPILMSKEVGERTIDFIIDKSKGGKRLSITFFGGEPLLNWPLIKHLVHYSQKIAKKSNRKTFYSLTTNGVLVTDEIASYLKKFNFGLMCSLDGPPEIQNKYRPLKNGKGSFYRAARGIKRIMKIRKQVTVRATMHRYNNEWLKLHDFFERFGFTRFVIGAATGCVSYNGPLDFGAEDIDFLNKLAEEELDFALERLKNGNKLYHNPFSVIKDIHNRKNTGIRCGVGKGTTIVSVNGKLYPCHRYLGMEEYCLGDIWNGYDEQKLYDYLLDYYKVKEYCKTCWLVNLCGGPCPWHVAHEDGHHHVPDQDFMCSLLRTAGERNIWIYEELKEKYPGYFLKMVESNNYC